MSMVADAADDAVLPGRVSPTAAIVIVRIPNRPSRPKAISIRAAGQRVRASSWPTERNGR
jgi:hypothetical protein